MVEPATDHKITKHFDTVYPISIVSGPLSKETARRLLVQGHMHSSRPVTFEVAVLQLNVAVCATIEFLRGFCSKNTTGCGIPPLPTDCMAKRLLLLREKPRVSSPVPFSVLLSEEIPAGR